MATLAENTIYLSMGGTVVSAYFVEVKLSASNDGQDTSAGSGADWKSSAPGLNEIKIDISIMHDAADIQAYIQKLAVGQVISIEYGPESNVSGKPRHVQDFLVTSNNHGVKISKAAVMYEISGVSSGAPSVNMFAAGVYS